MAFQRFDKNTSSSFPKITLTKCNSLGINAACVDKYFKDAKALELYYDGDSNRIGLKPFKKTDDHMYVIKRKEGQSASISCGGLIKHFGIQNTGTRRYIPAWNNKEKLLEIHLDKPISVANLTKVAAIERKAALKEDDENKGMKL